MSYELRVPLAPLSSSLSLFMDGVFPNRVICKQNAQSAYLESDLVSFLYAAAKAGLDILFILNVREVGRGGVQCLQAIDRV